MGRTCIICKNDSLNPYHKDRSFHRFPLDVDLKNKWMHALGLSSVAKTATICDEHFDEDSFHDTDGYTVVRRLLSKAVPKSITINIDDVNNCSKSAEDVSMNMDNNVSMENNMDNNVNNENNMDNNVNMENNSIINNDNDNNDNDNNDNNARNRKICCEKFPKKGIRFFTNYKTEWISRKDFVSNKSWQTFIRFGNYYRKILKSKNAKINRKQKIINIMKKQIKELQKKLKKEIVKSKYEYKRSIRLNKKVIFNLKGS